MTNDHSTSKFTDKPRMPITSPIFLAPSVPDSGTTEIVNCSVSQLLPSRPVPLELASPFFSDERPRICD